MPNIVLEFKEISIRHSGILESQDKDWLKKSGFCLIIININVGSLPFLISNSPKKCLKLQ